MMEHLQFFLWITVLLCSVAGMCHERKQSLTIEALENQVDDLESQLLKEQEKNLKTTSNVACGKDEFWTMRNGQRIAVSGMSEEHVRNTLRMIIRSKRRVMNILSAQEDAFSTHEDDILTDFQGIH